MSQHQPTLFPTFDASLNMPEPERAFDGETYEPAKDFQRLNAQCLRVYEATKDGQWRTLHAISSETGDPEASVSARLRDLRKPKFGGFDVQRRRVADRDGLWEYRLALPPQ